MKKVMFLNFNCNWCPHFETELELMLLHKEQGDKIYTVTCNEALSGYCVSRPTKKSCCRNCKKTFENGIKLLNIPKKNLVNLPLKKIAIPKFPTFKNIDELKKFSINGINIGFGTTSSLTTLARDYNYNTIANKDVIDKQLGAAYRVRVNFENIIKKHKPNIVYIFNGRFSEYYPAVMLCQKYHIDYYLHERGSSIKKYQLVKNDILHRLKRYQEEYTNFWEKEPDYNKKAAIAEKWFENKLGQVGKSSFVAEQQKGKLPANFNPNVENIAIFNSSLDEYAAFDDWANPIDGNINNILEEIIKHYQNDTTKHFYLRVHPNLKNLDTTQIKEIEEIAKKNYKNLTIIAADEDIDSYALMKNCSKSICFISTTGMEATYLGIPSILAGKAIYDILDCTHNATTYEELFKLIDNKNLKAKPKENIYPYIYWACEYGINFENFEATDIHSGLFLGKNIRAEIYPKKKLKQKLKTTFKKLFHILEQ